MSDIFKLYISIGSIVVLFVGGVSTFTTGHPVWSYILWGLAILWLLISIIYYTRKKKKIENKEENQTDIKVVDIYEDNKGECGLIINNTGKNPLKNCHARLIDLAFEIQNPHYSLERYPKSEDLICTKDIPEHGNGKIQLFRC